MKAYSKMSFVQAGRIGAVILAGTILTACQTRAELEGEHHRQSTFLVKDRYPINVKKGEVRLKVPTSHGGRFSRDQTYEIRKFLDDYPGTSAGHLYISTPTAGGGRANAAAGKVAQIAAASGVPASEIRYRNHQGSRRSPVVVAYRRHFAVTKKCGDWTDSMSQTYDNLPHSNWGCSQQHNIAAMAVDPRDLKRPRSRGSVDAGRMDTVFEKYRAGQPTSSTRGANETGTVADVE
ncbi:MAG: CpaD family pilus assembly protein [Pseudomonadota bacterium]